jgi:hypothetical protein
MPSAGRNAASLPVGVGNVDKGVVMSSTENPVVDGNTLPESCLLIPRTKFCLDISAS